MNDASIATLQAAILAAHRTRFAGQDGLPAQPTPATGGSADPIYQAALTPAASWALSPAMPTPWRWPGSGKASAWGRLMPASGPAMRQIFGLSAPDPAHAFAPCPQQLGLYAVLPDADWVGRMARAGVPTVQLRFKSDDPPPSTPRCKPPSLPCRAPGPACSSTTIGKRPCTPVLTASTSAKKTSMPCPPVRCSASAASGTRLGISTHGYAEMCKAHAVHPSYIALGAVFPPH